MRLIWGYCFSKSTKVVKSSGSLEEKKDILTVTSICLKSFGTNILSLMEIFLLILALIVK